jgi:hypothetical protein
MGPADPSPLVTDRCRLTPIHKGAVRRIVTASFGVMIKPLQI